MLILLNYLTGCPLTGNLLVQDSSDYTEALIRPILTNFSDSDPRTRYFACEALYNVVKVARGAVLPYFSDIFTGLSKLAAENDHNVKSASEHLDRLMKVNTFTYEEKKGMFWLLDISFNTFL